MSRIRSDLTDDALATSSSESDASGSDRRRGRRVALALLGASLVLGMTTWFSASAVIPQLRNQWALSDGSAAWLTIAVQLGFVGGALFSSVFNLSDLIPARFLIFGGALGASVMNLALLLADGPPMAIPLRLATGFFLAAVYPPALKLSATWFRKGRGMALGVLVGALTVGSAGPHLVNGLGALDWATVVYVTSILTAIGGGLSLLVPEGPFPFPRATFDPRQASLTMRNRGVRLASLGYFGHMWELYAMWAWFLVFFRSFLDARGSPNAAAASYATFTVISVGGLGCIAGGWLGDRWGRTRTTATMMAISGSCALLIGLLFDAPPGVVLFVALIWGFAVVADSAQFSTMVTELADQAYVGTALTLQLAIGFTLTVATVWLVPVMERWVGWTWAFALLVPGPALGVWAMLRLKSLPEAARIAGGRG
ncbi:MAG: MFS transporter [Actinomycetota bacterium]|nr:MFS transporter [Actinomycetota bacterium]